MVQLPPQQTIQALGGSLRRSVMILPHIGSHTSVHSVVRLALHGPTYGNTSTAGLYKVVTSSQSLLIVQFTPKQSIQASGGFLRQIVILPDVRPHMYV